MARTDAIVLGAGIVGTSAALHLAKRGLAVALVDRRGPGEETSYGNAGIIEGNTLFPHAFPNGFGALLRIALKQAPEANYHLSSLPQVAPWLLAYRANTRGEGSLAFAEAMRPLLRARGRRARGADGGGRRHALSAQGRLAQALSQRRGLRGDRARARLCDRARPQPSRLECRGGARRSSRRSLRCSATRCIGRTRRACPIRSRSPRPMRRGLRSSAASSLKGDARTLHRSDELARRHRRRADRRQGCRGRARALGAGRARPARHQAAARVQARLSPAFPLARQRRLDAADRRHRQRLLPRADGAGHPAHHRRRIRRPRCRADARAVRPR